MLKLQLKQQKRIMTLSTLHKPNEQDIVNIFEDEPVLDDVDDFIF